jgi:hypothetical protein
MLKLHITTKFPEIDKNRLEDYLNFITNCENTGSYKEKHHILPSSLFPEFKKKCIWNIKELTAKNHFIAHYLLLKLFPSDRKMVYAWKMMWVDKYRNFDEQFLSAYAEDYQAIRAKTRYQRGHIVSQETRKKIGDAQRGVARGPVSEETLKKRSEAKKNHTPEEFQKIKENRSRGQKTREFKQAELDRLKTLNLGRKQSEESKQKKSQANTGKPWSEKRRQSFLRSKTSSQIENP